MFDDSADEEDWFAHWEIIAQAEGVLSVRERIPIDEAVQLLRCRARSTGRARSEVAQLELDAGRPAP